MNLKSILLLFSSLLIANLLGQQSFTINIGETYYIINYMELIVSLVTIILGLMLTFKVKKTIKLFFKQNTNHNNGYK